MGCPAEAIPRKVGLPLPEAGAERRRRIAGLPPLHEVERAAPDGGLAAARRAEYGSHQFRTSSGFAFIQHSSSCKDLMFQRRPNITEPLHFVASPHQDVFGHVQTLQTPMSTHGAACCRKVALRDDHQQVQTETLLPERLIRYTVGSGRWISPSPSRSSSPTI